MTRPPQLNPNPVRTAEEIAAVVRLKRDGMTVRQIAAELGLSPTTVQRRLDAGLEATVSTSVEELRISETARLEALTKALAAGVRKGDVPAVAESRRIGESLRKLHGADAPVISEIQLTARTEMDAGVVADVLLAVIPAVLAAAGLDTVRMDQLRRYGLELAQHALAETAGQASGPPPQPPRRQLAITAGPAVRPPAAPPEPEPTAGPPEGLTPEQRAVLADVLADAEQPRPPRAAKDDAPPPLDDTSGWPPELRRRMSPMSKIIG